MIYYIVQYKRFTIKLQLAWNTKLSRWLVTFSMALWLSLLFSHLSEFMVRLNAPAQMDSDSAITCALSDLETYRNYSHAQSHSLGFASILFIFIFN